MATRSDIFCRVSTAALVCSAVTACAPSYARYTDWFGFELGQVWPTDDSLYDNNSRFGSRTGTVKEPTPPWTSIELIFSKKSGRLESLWFFNQSRGFAICDHAPCPQLPRTKSIEQIRADGKRIRADLIARLGPPTNSGEGFTTWDYVTFARCREANGVTARQPVLDASALLNLVHLEHTDDDVVLRIEGANQRDTIPPGEYPSPTSPEPPCR